MRTLRSASTCRVSGWTIAAAQAGALGDQNIASIGARESFGHLAAAGVADAHEQHSLLGSLNDGGRALGVRLRDRDVGSTRASHAMTAAAVSPHFAHNDVLYQSSVLRRPSSIENLGACPSLAIAAVVSAIE